MNIYEEMWKLAAQKLINAKTHSLEQTVTYETIIQLFVLIEQSNKDLIDAYQKEKTDEEVKEQTGMDPV